MPPSDLIWLCHQITDAKSLTLKEVMSILSKKKGSYVNVSIVVYSSTLGEIVDFETHINKMTNIKVDVYFIY